MKKLFVLFFMCMAVLVRAQGPLSDNFNCGESVRTDCNYILNPEFKNGGATTDAFWLNDVYYWTASHGTPDINTNFTAPPIGTDYATMTIGNDQSLGQNLDEGIITRTGTLYGGKEYAFSFYRAFGTNNPTGLTTSEDFTLKIVLLNCDNIFYSDGSPNSYNIPDYTQLDHQVIYCEENMDLSPNWDYWHRISFKFTAERDFDAVMIFAERNDPNIPDTYNEIYIAYPELIDVPSPVQLTHERIGCYEMVYPRDVPPCLFEGAGATVYYTSPYLPYTLTVTSWPVYLNLSKPGTYHFYYALTSDWFDNNSCSENIDRLSMGDVTIGCADECHCGVRTDFNCSTHLQLPGCNQIPNPDFDVILPSVQLDAFNLGNVIDWGYTSANTSDINGSGNPFMVAPPLPTELAGKNYASMLATHPQYLPSYVYGESIAAKIEKVEQGKTYAFSFYLASTALTNASYYGGNATFTFKAMLTDCQDFPNSLNNYPLYLAHKQDIFCERFVQLAGTPWRQYFVSFTADADYEMLIFYNEVQTSDPFGHSYLHIAYPELIDITENYTIDPQSECEVVIGPDENDLCSVMNAEYVWTDPSNNIVYQSADYEPLEVNLANAGTYTLSMVVPGAATSMSNCSDNEVVVSTIHVPSTCKDCGGTLVIDTATVEKLFMDDGSGLPGPYHTVDLLQDIDENCSVSVCHFIDEGHLNFHLVSNMPTGNVWSIYRDGYPVGTYQSYLYYSTPSPAVNTNQVFDPKLVFINFYGPTTIEIRLNNGSQEKSFFMTINPQVYMSTAYAGCYYNNVTAMMEIYINSITYVTPSTQYTWDMSNNPSFVYTQPSVNSPNLYFDPTQPALSGGGFDATVITSGSQYGCERRRHFWISSNIYECNGPYWRTQNGTNEEKTIATEIYPNPVNNTFRLTTSKEIKQIDVYAINGQLMKRFMGEDLLEMEYNIEELKPGSYGVRINYVDGSIDTKVIVKQ